MSLPDMWMCQWIAVGLREKNVLWHLLTLRGAWPVWTSTLCTCCVFWPTQLATVTTALLSRYGLLKMVGMAMKGRCYRIVTMMPIFCTKHLEPDPKTEWNDDSWSLIRSFQTSWSRSKWTCLCLCPRCQACGPEATSLIPDPISRYDPDIERIEFLCFCK